jgi:hypothetical protein
MGWLAELLALVSASAFTGAAFYINVAEHPARMTLSADAALAQWKPAYKSGALMQASLALVGALCAFAAAYASRDWRWVLAGAVLLVNWPYTLLVIMPVNKRLMVRSSNDDEETTRALLHRWNRLHAVRTVFGAASALIAIWIVMT